MPKSNLELIFITVSSVYIARKKWHSSHLETKKAYLFCSGCSASPKITVDGFKRMTGEGR